MNTHNVNTATKESSERWDINRLNRAIAYQKSLLSELCCLRNEKLTEKDEAEIMFGILDLMSENILRAGVSRWAESRPLVSLPVAQPWLQAKAHAIRLYGDTGAVAWEHSRKNIKDQMEFERGMLEMEAEHRLLEICY